MTVSQEGGQHEDVWLDMSRYPDTDPDAVLSSEDHGLLTSSLAVDDTELPDAVWEHMLAVVVGNGDTGADDATDDVADGPPADGDDGAAWSDEVAEHHTGDPGADDDPAVHDPGHDPALHDDGGWV